VDEVLSDFFRAAMPAPWPAAPAGRPGYGPPATPWARRLPRLALAASVGLLFVGYLTLASAFPRDEAVIDLGTGPIIGQKAGHGRGGDLVVPFLPGSVERVRTPQGQDATVIDETTQGDRAVRMITIQQQNRPR
jgi:hypothetical protein